MLTQVTSLEAVYQVPHSSLWRHKHFIQLLCPHVQLCLPRLVNWLKMCEISLVTVKI